MRIAFYAPLKPPSHPVPSGDRRIARLLLQADTELMLNPNDEECVAPLLRRRRGALHGVHGTFGAGDDFAPWVRRARARPAAAEPLLPFLATEPYRQAAKRRAEHRKDAA